MAAGDQIEPPRISNRTLNPMTGRGEGLHRWGWRGVRVCFFFWGGGVGIGQDKSASPAKIRPGIFIRAAAITQLMIDGQEIIWQPF